MSRYKKHRRDLEREAAVLNKPINQTGAGEDQAIKDLLSPDFLTMTDSGAAQIALALQQIIRGQASLLANQDVLKQDILKMKANMDKYDRDAARWREEREKFLNEINDRAEKLLLPAAKKAELRAREGKRLTARIQQAKASKTVERLQFEQLLASQPKVTIISPGISRMVREGGSIIHKIFPEEIRIKHRVWYLTPNVPTEVPELVAQVYQERQATRAAGEKRKELLRLNGGIMTGNNVDSVMARKWAELNREEKIGGFYDTVMPSRSAI
jgi:hypothetical protein